MFPNSLLFIIVAFFLKFWLFLEHPSIYICLLFSPDCTPLILFYQEDHRSQASILLIHYIERRMSVTWLRATASVTQATAKSCYHRETNKIKTHIKRRDNTLALTLTEHSAFLHCNTFSLHNHFLHFSQQRTAHMTRSETQQPSTLGRLHNNKIT